jgi:hypothetical protein
MSDDTTLLRHTIATLAYRLEKVIRDIPPGFDNFEPGADMRTPLSILGHIGDLAEWGERLVHGEYRWTPIGGLSWDEQRDRIFASLARTDARLAEDEPGSPAGQIFQGPIADALTHVGQLAMLRRMAGRPVRAESYARAEIEVGRGGASWTGSVGETRRVRWRCERREVAGRTPTRLQPQAADHSVMRAADHPG